MQNIRERFWTDNYPEGVPKDIDPEKYPNLNALIDEAFDNHPQAIAYTCLGRSITFFEARQYAEKISQFLMDEGFEKGDRVAVMLPNILQNPVAIIGVLRAGLIVVNVNPLYSSRELCHQLCDSEAKVIIILGNFCDKLADIISKTQINYVIQTNVGDFLGLKGKFINFYLRFVKKVVPMVSFSGVSTFQFSSLMKRHYPTNPKTVRLDSSEIAFLQYTGGTTGTSKAAVLTHRNMIANCLQAEAWFQPVLKELSTGKTSKTENVGTMVCALPLYHIFALTACLFLGLRVSLRNLLIPNPRDFKGFVKTLSKENFHIFPGVNTLFNYMMKEKKFSDLDFTELKVSLGGGMAVTSSVAERWQEKTGCSLIEGYGLSETAPCVSVVPVTSRVYTGNVGLPVPSTLIKILGESSQDLGVGVMGEIAVSGPQVMREYWKNEEETKKVFTKDGFFKTGDIGVIDSSGYLKIVDRKKDMIIVSGFNVYPNEIEDVVSSFEGIVECAVVGMPDKDTGESVKLFYVVDGQYNFNVDELKSFCRGNLAAYKCPKQFEERKTLPKSNVGKILRKELR